MDGTWTVQPPILPTRPEPDPLPPIFSQGQRLAAEFIDTLFTGGTTGAHRMADQPMPWQSNPIRIRLSTSTPPGTICRSSAFEQITT
jgi:hypothetical protein